MCAAEELQGILEGLKAHADSYTATLLELRRDYLSCGRRGRDVEDAKDAMRQSARRIDSLGKLAAYGIRSMVPHPCFCSPRGIALSDMQQIVHNFEWFYRRVPCCRALCSAALPSCYLLRYSSVLLLTFLSELSEDPAA